MRITLDQKDFETLVSGGIVQKPEVDIDVEIILSDIGFHAMVEAINKAISKK